MRKHWRDWVSWCVLLLVAFFIARRTFYVVRAEGIDRMPLRYRLLQSGFHPDDWKRADDLPSAHRSSSRARMVGDLLASQDLIGLRGDDVTELLGHGSYDFWPEAHESFFLGPGFIDDWWLTVHYDDEGFVDRVRVRMD